MSWPAKQRTMMTGLFIGIGLLKNEVQWDIILPSLFFTHPSNIFKIFVPGNCIGKAKLSIPNNFTISTGKFLDLMSHGPIFLK